MKLRLMDRIVNSFSIGRLVVVSLVARILTLFLLPPTPSFLAPDEGTYADIASWVAQSQNVEEFPLYGAGLYNTSKTLVLPAAVLVRIGLNELTAVRVVSIVFGLLSIYFFSRITFLVFGISHVRHLRNVISQRLVVAVLAFFAFFPSLFIWSTLGLRESASIATIFASIFLLLRLRETNFSKKKMLESVLAIFLPILSLALSFGARRETSFVFVVFFCLPLLIMSTRRNFFSLTSVIIVGTVLGLSYSTTPSARKVNVLVWMGTEQAPSALKSLDKCEEVGRKKSTNSGEFVCTSLKLKVSQITLSEIIKQVPVTNLDDLEDKRHWNRDGAQTALAVSTCNNFLQFSLQNVQCNAKELPYRLGSILVRPLPIVDSGSLSQNLASAENLLWIMLLIGFLYFLGISIQRRYKLEVTIPTSVFVLSFSILASLYEGNLGTAFRHKSTILWGLLLVIAIGLDMNWRKSEEKSQKKNPR